MEWNNQSFCASLLDGKQLAVWQKVILVGWRPK